VALSTLVGNVNTQFTIIAPAFNGPLHVSWTNATGVTTNGNNLTKSGGSGAWNTSGAASAQVIKSGYGFVEFTATETNTQRIAGLSNGDTNQDWIDIDYGILLRDDSTFGIYEGGQQRGSSQPYSAADRFRVEVRYGVVRYLRNGNFLLASSAVPIYPLRVDTALYTPGATVTDVRVGTLVWSDATGAVVAGEALTKTGAAGWNSGAISTNTIESGDGYFEFTATQTNTLRAAGLAMSSTPAYANITFGVELRANGQIDVIESGTSRGPFGTYLAGDRFRVEVLAGVVRYYRGGVQFYQSNETPAFPLRGMAALNTVDSVIVDAALEPIVWTNTTGVALVGATLVKINSGTWNAAASSTNAIVSGDGWMEFTAIEIDAVRVAGLKNAGGASSYTQINFAIRLTATGTVEVVELGQERGTYGSYANGDRFRVEIQYGVVRYRKNGVVFYTSGVAPSPSMHAEVALSVVGATVGHVAVGDLVWATDVGVKATGHSLQKTAASSSWNTAGAFSTKFINTQGNGYVEWTASEITTNRVVGLENADMNQDSTDIDYGIWLKSDATVAIYESGNNRGSFGSYAPGDRFRVEVSSGVVKYYKNGTQLYPSNVTPPAYLGVDTAFLEPSSFVFNVVFSGTPMTPQLAAPTMSPGQNTYNVPQNVTLSHTLNNVTIRYTLDGSTPTSASPAYASPLTIDQTRTLKTIAQKPGYLDSNQASATYTMKVGTPSISVNPSSGPYYTPPVVTLSSVTPSPTIRYTLDGTEPTDSSALYSGPITINQSGPLKVRATKTGWDNSDVAQQTFELIVAALALAPPPSSYSGAQTVTISTNSPGASFRYTMDGSMPVAGSAVANGSTITVDRSATLKVQGFRAGWTDSVVFTGNYFVNLGTVSTPTFAPVAGTFTVPQNVTIATATSGATIRYTTDGTEPSIRSRVYVGPLLVKNTTHLKAKAFKADMTASSTEPGLFVINTGAVDTPRFSPGSGSYTTYQTVTIKTETAGATIHYTTNGAEPTESDQVIASGSTLAVNNSMTLRTKAWKSGMTPSDAGIAVYEITGAVAAGGLFSLGLKPDGTVWSWGSNSVGQLGRSAGGSSLTPGQIPTLSDVVQIATGDNFAFALTRDGKVWAWGHGQFGKLGLGDETDRSSPVWVSSLTDVIGIAGGVHHSLAVKSDGTVWIWGRDTDNNFNYGFTPGLMAGVSGVTEVRANSNTSFVLKTDGASGGTVWAWGNNLNGQLGDGTQVKRTTPAMVLGLANVAKIAVGYTHAVAAKTDGTVWAWGSNLWGAVGDGTSNNTRAIPTVSALQFLNPITALGTGDQLSIATVFEGNQPDFDQIKR